MKVIITTILLPLLAAAFAFAAEPTRVLVPKGLENRLADLEESVPNLDLVFFSNGEERDRLAPTCEAFVGWSLDESTLKAGKGIRWVQVASAGVRRYVTMTEMRNRDITLTNFKIYQGPEIADHAMGMLLFLSRNLGAYHGATIEGEWDRSPEESLPLVELRGKTMLVIGLGGIGTQVAQRAWAHGMRVVATDAKDIPLMRFVDYVGKPDELHELLPQADVIVSAVPWTDKTESLLDEEAFALMKDGVYLINISRGIVVDTEALIEALDSGKVRGAGLDVTDPEPLPAGHSLWSRPNVIITPHVAGRSDRRTERLIALYRDNIERFAKGLPLKNVVGIERGY